MQLVPGMLDSEMGAGGAGGPPPAIDATAAFDWWHGISEESAEFFAPTSVCMIGKQERNGINPDDGGRGNVVILELLGLAKSAMMKSGGCDSTG